MSPYAEFWEPHQGAVSLTFDDGRPSGVPSMAGPQGSSGGTFRRAWLCLHARIDAIRCTLATHDAVVHVEISPFPEAPARLDPLLVQPLVD